MEPQSPADGRSGGGAWTGGLISIIVCFGLACVWGVNQLRYRTVTFYEVSSSPLPDKDVLDYSKKALENAISGSGGFNAIAANPGAGKVIRQSGNRDIAHVLWDDPKNSDTWTYGVTVQRFNDRIECTVSPAD